MISLLDRGGTHQLQSLFTTAYTQNRAYFREVAAAGGPSGFISTSCSMIKWEKETVKLSVPFLVCRENTCKCGGYHVCSHWPRKVATCKVCTRDPTKNPDNRTVYKKFPMLADLTNQQLKRLLKHTRFIIRPQTPVLFEKCLPDNLNFPNVCRYHNSEGGCHRPCLFFHLCDKFVAGQCQKGDSCSRSHNFESEHNSKIVQTCSGIPLDSGSIVSVINHETSVTALAIEMLQADSRIHNDEVDVCVWNLVGKCAKEGSCPLHHVTLPFWWQYESDGEWESWDIDSILILERAYANPVICTVEIRIGDVIAIIDFPTMTMMEGGHRIRRLSTPPEHGDQFVGSLATSYHWHWEENNNVWHEFPSCVTQGKHSPQLELPSHVIEQTYLRGDSQLNFRISDSDFTLFFGGMQMKELGCSTVRRISRRPIYRTVPQCVGLVVGHDKTTHQYYTLFRESVDAELETVRAMMKMNTPLSVKTICSNLLETQFSKRNKSTKTIFLFHPVTETMTPEGLAQHGLTPADTPTSMKKYGTGIHLAVSEEYAMYFGCNTRAVVAVECVVGMYGRGKPADTKPPVSERGVRLQSCVNNVDRPEVFVLYDVMAVRPRFWISF